MHTDVWVDYNNLDEHGEMTTWTRYVRPGVVVEVGRRLLVADDDGSSCEAVVLAVEPTGRLRLRLLLDTLHAVDPEADPG